MTASHLPFPRPAQSPDAVLIPAVIPAVIPARPATRPATGHAAGPLRRRPLPLPEPGPSGPRTADLIYALTAVDKSGER
ncbi:hypothetical protein [Actinoplanes sp. NPDC026619]|uniref:hypothetical protein n=1 Tax=Actinoplanes sp. NPDC026619 TaxID=3155798 RepID=UPI0033D63FEA